MYLLKYVMDTRSNKQLLQIAMHLYGALCMVHVGTVLRIGIRYVSNAFLTT